MQGERVFFSFFKGCVSLLLLNEIGLYLAAEDFRANHRRKASYIKQIMSHLLFWMSYSMWVILCCSHFTLLSKVLCKQSLTCSA